MSIYYSNLDWPCLTPDDHDELFAHAHSSVNIKVKTKHSDRGYHHYNLPPRLEAWCKERLPIDERYKIVLQRFFGGNQTFNIPRHVDGQRIENFNYLITPTGPITRWFDHNAVVESVVFPQYKWAKLKVDSPHDVININAERIAISIFVPI